MPRTAWPMKLYAARLGDFLDYPCPPLGWFIPPKGNDLFYASLDFNLTGNTLPPVNVTKCIEVLPQLSTGVLLFDILIANSDRHGRNLSVDFSSKPPTMNVFDHGHAMFGKDAGEGVSRLERLKERLSISAGSRTAVTGTVCWIRLQPMSTLVVGLKEFVRSLISSSTTCVLTS